MVLVLDSSTSGSLRSDVISTGWCPQGPDAIGGAIPGSIVKGLWYTNLGPHLSCQAPWYPEVPPAHLHSLILLSPETISGSRRPTGQMTAGKVADEDVDVVFCHLPEGNCVGKRLSQSLGFLITTVSLC